MQLMSSVCVELHEFSVWEMMIKLQPPYDIKHVYDQVHQQPAPTIVSIAVLLVVLIITLNLLFLLGQLNESSFMPTLPICI